MKQPTLLSIIILNYNTKELSSTCLNSIIKQYKEELEKDEFETLFVDNASKDSSVENIKKQVLGTKNIKILENKENFGFSKGNNIGAEAAKGEYLLFLNSDTEVLDRALLKMLEFIQKDKTGILGLKLKNPDGSVQASCGKFYNIINTIIMLFGGERFGLLRSSPESIKEVDWVSGASLVIKKDLFKELKGFDENLFMYMEDMELCFRVKEKSFKIKFFPEIEIIHKEQGSSNRSFAILNIYKGLTYFYKKHKPFWQFTLIKLLLIIKARLSIFIGKITKNDYLVSTYQKALNFDS